jgi:polyhydroxybutyrate depolymerase
MRFTPRMKLGSALLLGALLTGCGGSESSPGGAGGTGEGAGGTQGGAAGTVGTAGTTGAAGTTGPAGSTGTTGAAGDSGEGGSSSTGTGGSETGRGGSTGTAGSPGHGGSSAGTAGNGSGGSTGKGGSGAGGSGTGTAGSPGTAGSGPVTCPSTVLKAGDMNLTVQVPATTSGPTPGPAMSRTYILHVPSAYKGTSPVPLVVDWHPLGGSGSQEESGSPFKAQTDPEGVITAYPNGKSGPSGNAFNVVGCCVANVDDVAFARALVAQVETMACIDTKRVYAVGFSMGGGMSHFLACVANDIFAATAPQSFDLLQGNKGFCAGRPVSVIAFRGKNDTLVNYTGGNSSVVNGMPINFLGAVGTFNFWGQFDGCTDTPAAADASGCQYYKSCKGGTQVGLCTMNSGHAYGDGKVGWSFIKQFSLP